MKHLSILLAATLATLSTPVLAHAQHHKGNAQGIVISQAWARETAPAQVNGGGFLTIINKGAGADRLIATTSPVSPTVQLHTMTMDGGVMRMRELPDGILVPPHGSVELKPGGMHIMFIGLKAPFKPGQNVPLTLRFEKAGTVKAVLSVKAITDTVPTMGASHEHR